MKGQRAYGSQNTLEEDKEGRGTFSTWQQGSLQYYSKDSVDNLNRMDKQTNGIH